MTIKRFLSPQRPFVMFCFVLFCFVFSLGDASEVSEYRGQLQTEMAHTASDVCEMQLDGVSEVMDLLQIDVETDVVEDRPGGQDPSCSVSVFI